MRQITPEEADKAILALALEHQLVTRLTSLVAVDRTPSRPDGARLTRADLPLNLPAGWDFDKVFGGARPPVRCRQSAGPTPNRCTRPQRDAYARVTVSTAPKPVAPRPIVPGGQSGVILPKTATDAELRLWFGLLLCVASLILICVWHRRRNPAGCLPQ